MNILEAQGRRFGCPGELPSLRPETRQKEKPHLMARNHLANLLQIR